MTDIRVLVAYASKYGATAEIAERIGKVLQDRGLQADVLPAEHVRDLAPYQAVILGSAVYMSNWRKPAVAFLKANEKALAARPVWLFSSGPPSRKDEAFAQGKTLPNALKPIADRIRPRDIVVFHGFLNPRRLNFIEKWMIKNVKAPYGDFRRWKDIRAWTNSIAAALKGPAQADESRGLASEDGP